MIEELKKEYQKWAEKQSTPGYKVGWAAGDVWRFLEERENQKPRSVPCKSAKDVRENAVAIMTLMGNPNLTRKSDLMEIDEAAREIYDYCVSASAGNGA